MTDQKYIVVLSAGFIGTVGLLVWGALALGGPARSSHQAAAEVGDAADTLAASDMATLSRQIDALDQRLATIGALPLGSTLAGSAVHTPAQPTEGEILVQWVDSDIPLDPLSTTWSPAPMTVVSLQPQNQAVPMVESATIDHVRIQAITNGRQIGWRVSWPDPEPNRVVDAGRFCDAVAVQLPLKSNAAYTMGASGFPVQILHWKALWQQDLDEHFQGVEDLYPNYWTDLYWFANGTFPYRVPESFSRPESRDWFVAYRAGNPMANIERMASAEELTAEGFGSLTHQAHSVTVGRGTWQAGEWTVVFLRPMETVDPDDYQFAPGTRDTVAFAVWDGKEGNVGARKQHSQWIVFEVQK